ncbi:hypothetical protein HS096_02020 [candidate division WWE3 bacterium]|uniref:Uncharacterized protein n=1 Tax=candidate division WWE3 bacterium TaxID=2053526 RepID=A0A928TS76_UNCKA|nr:hypothetical protein [candidate division WWE3 bacterium]
MSKPISARSAAAYLEASVADRTAKPWRNFIISALDALFPQNQSLGWFLYWQTSTLSDFLIYTKQDHPQTRAASQKRAHGKSS